MQPVLLRSPNSRKVAHDLIERAPQGAMMEIKPPKRSGDQNRKMWALLGDVSRAKPQGREHTPEVWKSLFMNALGYEVRFVMGLSGEPFPIGFRTSRLSKEQMSELIEFIYAYGAEHGVRWTE